MSGGPVPIVIVAAVSRNNVIGRGGDLPWRLSTDLKRFKEMTLGKPVVLGRKTFESFGGRPLPGRPHVVVTRNAGFAAAGVETAASLPEAIARAQVLAEQTGAADIAIIGGGEIYRQAMPIADRLAITHVETVIDDGDTFFPVIDHTIFTKIEEQAFPAGERDNFPTRFAVYRRRDDAI
ncbi:dihydrofolate reductase [Rhizobium sp. SAFR-030]|uniref:dihydrofolate reductase n=1 Tax=Rhizobium sp. SAFR-030 TaxID=3387277 RepID=UPI003F7FA71D